MTIDLSLIKFVKLQNNIFGPFLFKVWFPVVVLWFGSWISMVSAAEISRSSTECQAEVGVEIAKMSNASYAQKLASAHSLSKIIALIGICGSDTLSDEQIHSIAKIINYDSNYEYGAMTMYGLLGHKSLPYEGFMYSVYKKWKCEEVNELNKRSKYGFRTGTTVSDFFANDLRKIGSNLINLKLICS